MAKRQNRKKEVILKYKEEVDAVLDEFNKLEKQYFKEYCESKFKCSTERYVNLLFLSCEETYRSENTEYLGAKELMNLVTQEMETHTITKTKITYDEDGMYDYVLTHLENLLKQL